MIINPPQAPAPLPHKVSRCQHKIDSEWSHKKIYTSMYYTCMWNRCSTKYDCTIKGSHDCLWLPYVDWDNHAVENLLYREGTIILEYTVSWLPIESNWLHPEYYFPPNTEQNSK